MQRSDQNISDFPYDVLEPLFVYLPLKDTLSLLGTCHSLYANTALHKKQIRKAYIRQFLTEQTELISKYSDEEAFDQLLQEFIYPLEKSFIAFKISSPIPIEKIPLFIQGKFMGLAPADICLSLGFEKLYLQLLKCCVWYDKRRYCAQKNFDQIVIQTLTCNLGFFHQRDLINTCKYPAAMLLALVNHVSPFLYFIGLCATLIEGRVDIFDALLREFEIKKEVLNNHCYIEMEDERISIVDKKGNDDDFDQNTVDLTLENIKQWSPQFKAEFDKFVLSNYAEWSSCEAIFELCLAKRNEFSVNHPLHFLWACYTGDASCLLNYLRNPATLIETVYCPANFSESQFSTRYRKMHPKVENMQESAISLYARNAHQEDKNIISILLDKPSICARIHMRDAYQRTALLIALAHHKFQLLEAMLAKTDKEILETQYSDKEKNEIDTAMKKYHAQGVDNLCGSKIKYQKM